MERTKKLLSHLPELQILEKIRFALIVPYKFQVSVLFPITQD